MEMKTPRFSVEWLLCEESFQQYCLGTNAESQNLWEQWIIENPDKKVEFFEAKRLFFVLSAQQGNREQQLTDLKSGIAQIADFKSQFDAQELEFFNVRPIKKSKLNLTSISLVAASLLLIASLFVYFNYLNLDGQNVLEFSSGRSSRRTVILEDGSVITLRRNSRLKLSPTFDNNEREVWLTGEAFFNISHNKAKPFIVHAGENNITVLGTIFNVMAYPNASFTETTLLEGMVRITHNLDSELLVILKPHQKLVSKTSSEKKKLQPNQSVVVKPEVMLVKNNSGTETKWVRNKMSIEDESLKEIANKLENFYGVKIQINDEEVGKYRYSGVFENESLIKTLEALQLSYHFNFKAEQNKISISK